MKYLIPILTFVLASTLWSQDIKHPKLLVAGLSHGAMYIENGKVVKTLKTPGYTQDVWQLKDGSVLVVGSKGLWKYDPNGKVILKREPKGVENHTCMPLPRGRSLVAENGPKRILILKPDFSIEKEIIPEGVKSKNRHMQMRNVRMRPNGEIVVIASGEDKVVILNADGTTKKIIDMKKLPAPIKVNKTHGLALLANGNMLIGTGYGSCIVELTPEGKVVWQLTAKDIPEIGFHYAAGMHVRANGNIVVAAYKSKYALFEVTRDKKIVWKIPGGGEIGKPTHVQVLSEKGDPENFGLVK